MAIQIKLQKWGNSHGIRINKAILEQIGVDSLEDVVFEVELEKGAIKLSVVKPEVSYLDELFANYHGDDKPEPFDVGPPVGREIIKD